MDGETSHSRRGIGRKNFAWKINVIITSFAGKNRREIKLTQPSYLSRPVSLTVSADGRADHLSGHHQGQETWGVWTAGSEHAPILPRARGPTPTARHTEEHGLQPPDESSLAGQGTPSPLPGGCCEHAGGGARHCGPAGQAVAASSSSVHASVGPARLKLGDQRHGCGLGGEGSQVGPAHMALASGSTPPPLPVPTSLTPPPQDPHAGQQQGPHKTHAGSGASRTLALRPPAWIPAQLR